MFNRALLDYEMDIRGITKDSLCNELGMSRSALYRKRKGITEFTEGDMQKLSGILGTDAVIRIFFSKECPQRHNRP